MENFLHKQIVVFKGVRSTDSVRWFASYTYQYELRSVFKLMIARCHSEPIKSSLLENQPIRSRLQSINLKICLSDFLQKFTFFIALIFSSFSFFIFTFNLWFKKWKLNNLTISVQVHINFKIPYFGVNRYSNKRQWIWVRVDPGILLAILETSVLNLFVVIFLDILLNWMK